jgi:hypothetical protein
MTAVPGLIETTSKAGAAAVDAGDGACVSTLEVETAINTASVASLAMANACRYGLA